MLGRRAQQVSARQKPTTSTTKASIQNTEKMSSHERLSLWRAMVLRLFAILEYTMVESMTIAKLGTPVFKTLFPRLDDVKPSQASSSMALGNEAKGRMLKPAKGTALTDPKKCTHPDTLLKRRGNSKGKWWTCGQCNARWERLPVGTVKIPPTQAPVKEEPDDLSDYSNNDEMEMVESPYLNEGTQSEQEYESEGALL